MSDDKKNPGPEDGKLISLKQPHEVDYWCEHFAVEPDELQEVVDKVGHSKAAVEKEFQERQLR